MSMNRSPKCECLPKYKREEMYVKLRFLSSVIGGIDDALSRAIMDDNDIWAISMLLIEIADQIFPEWKEAQS
ncbi:hypothetical protein LJC09_03325 [Desulfovibrio sp. OttesenSCG-928-F20]|nr:hypothetical protein [Desulfovibrio sp. OttesenSCG-928-M16]MDL2291113.1 hypothetical protein [Desulfovibrio sp. OttesenSCG-928-F20]